MGIWNRKCAVEGCDDKDSPRHRFPMPHKDWERFKTWIKATGNAKLRTLDPDLVYRSHRICDQHFTSQYRASNKHLRPNAIPNLCVEPVINDDIETDNLDTPSNNEGLNISFGHMFAKDVTEEASNTTDHNHSSSPKIYAKPSTSGRVHSDTKSKCMYRNVTGGASTSVITDHNYTSSPKICDQPSTSGTSYMRSYTNTKNTNTRINVTEKSSISKTTDHLYPMSSTPSTSAAPNSNLKNTIQFTVNKENNPINLEITYDPSVHATPDEYVQILDAPKSSKKRKRSINVLHETGVRKVLSPREKLICNKARHSTENLSIFKQRSNKYKTIHGSMSEEELLDTFTCDLEKNVAKFIKQHIKASKVNSTQRRRFNMLDKVLGLILQKQCGKSYVTFSKLFDIPRKKTLMPLLNRITIEAGINDTIFKNLKISVNNLAEKDKVCILMFDEMAVEGHLDINKKHKDFDGLEDHGDNEKFADHAQVFMIKGINKRWKQPIAYTFSSGTISSIDLVRQIKLIVSECQKAGLKVIATVSDQGTENVGAINYLVNNHGVPSNEIKNLKIYQINGETLVHIYDAPHLIKGIRNNLLKRKLVWKINESIITGDWNDVVKTYEIDKESGNLRILNKILKGHVYEKNMKKRKVSYATQVFSHTMASIMRLFEIKGITSGDGQIKLEKSAQGTVRLLLFFDELFDSVNGHTLYPLAGKPLKSAVRATSGHVQFWTRARQHLRNMRYKEPNGRLVRPPSLVNWEVSLHGFEHLKKHLKEDFSITFFRPRDINLDPIENFFGQICEHGGSNVKPSANTFKNFFKTLLINNMVNTHSVLANCEGEAVNSQIIIDGVQNLVSQGLEENRKYRQKQS